MADINAPIKTITDRLKRECAVVAAAKLVFASMAVLLVLITALSVWRIVRARDEVQIRELRSTIVSLEGTIETLQKRRANAEGAEAK